MASYILQQRWYVEDVLTDATSVLLSDDTGSFGVKRNDTDAVVVVDGTAMTKVSTGVYEYTFDVVVGIAYTAFVEVVYGGNTYHIERDLGTISEESCSITAATDLDGSQPTEEMIYAIINKIDVAIHNMICGGGDLDYEELGPVGFRIEGAKSITALRQLRESYIKSLTDPDTMLEVVELRTQWDNPAL